MDGKTLAMLVLTVAPMVAVGWRESGEDEDRPLGKFVHRVPTHHAKRHMQADPEAQDIAMGASPVDGTKRRVAVPRYRKKPTGHLQPLPDDDMDNDEVVSVAIGPPAIMPKYDRTSWKLARKTKTVQERGTPSLNGNLTRVAKTMVQDILTQLGREFLTHQVSEEFVFGQYIGNALRNMSSYLKLLLQHEMLDLIVKYQKLNHGDLTPTKTDNTTKPIKPEHVAVTPAKGAVNDTEDVWPEFTNLAKIVG